MTWLAGLLLTTFVIGTDDFMIAGILPDIAADFGVSEAAAAQLVTVFSLVYAAAAPVMAVTTARLPRKRLIVGGLGLFAVINLATVFAPSYAALMALRVAAALVAATISPAAFAIAGTLAPPGRTGRAIGTVAAGLTVSLVIGVPLGSWIGGGFGWHATFVLVAALTTIAVAVTALTLPRMPETPVVSVRERLVLLRRPAVLTCVIGTIIGATSGLMPYIFIAPVIGDVSGGDRGLVPVVIGLYGLAGAAGTVIGGRLNDRWGTDRAVLALLVVVLASTIAITVTGLVFGGLVPFWLLAALIVVWGVAGWAYNPPMNARALQLAGPAGTEAIALNTSGLYIGIALAGAIGGGALNLAGGIAVLAAASGIGLINLVFMTVAVRRYPSKPLTQPAPTHTDSR
ncbi:MFS transporter [Brachybacterium sacelli]|uniref:MFS family arabinose efflux permease n=1 Tax=Brachybacterium sacelli TaxID=173364 RepID=A0ABS4X1Z1_9MICO|nr:MFS transporter [Brachybacterium sacelli]MBP2382477.1 putative MFS family arabinose efflux permease [Brachybacterium sacelli]